MRIKTSADLLLPTSFLGQQFCHYFNCGKYFIYKSNDRWYTETRFPLTPRTLWRRYQDKSQVIGIRFDSQTNFFVLDIDPNSKYHYRYDPFDFYGILECLTDIGINKVIKLQSSSREGIHLFGFLPQKINSYALACALEKVLTINGFVIKPGQLEIFPNPKPYNPTGEKSCGFNGIRLPLQQGTGAKLYNSKMRLVNGGIKKFLRQANKSTQEQNMGILKNYANRAVKWHKEQKTTNYQEQRRKNYRLDMEVAAFTGWSDRGETNEILKSITNYGWVILELRTWEELAEYIQATAISLPGYEQYCQHKREITTRAKHWAKSGCRYWAHKWSYPDRKGKTYGELIDEVERGVNAEIRQNAVHPYYGYINQKRKTEFRDRLQSCLAAIGSKNLPRQVKDCIKLLQSKSQELFGMKFSPKTLKRPENRILWHFKYRPKRLPSAPFVLLKAIAIQAQLLQQTIAEALERISDKIQSQEVSEKSAQKKTPQCNVVHLPKTPEKIDTNPVAAIVSEKDPTMKCLGASPSRCLYLWLWMSSRVFKYYKNELEKINQETLNFIKDNPSSEIEDQYQEIKSSALKTCHQQEINKPYSFLSEDLDPNLTHISNDHRLMMCLEQTPYLMQRVFILKLGLIKQEIKQKLENLFIPEIKTKEAKFKEIRKARRKNSYFYHGIEVSSRSALTGRDDELNNLKPGTKIRILRDYHSSSLGDDNRQILVYVKPTEFKTKEKYLVPLESLIPVLDRQNYNLAILPLVKELVHSLGLNRTDYLDYLEKTYQVSRTRYLSNSQVFQVIKYFQDLLLEPFFGRKYQEKRIRSKQYRESLVYL